MSTQHGWQGEINAGWQEQQRKTPFGTPFRAHLCIIICAAMPKQPYFKNRHFICKPPYQPVGIEPMLRGSIGIANGDKALEVSDGLKLPPNQTSGMQRWCRRQRSVAFVSEILLALGDLTLKRNMALHNIFRASVCTMRCTYSTVIDAHLNYMNALAHALTLAHTMHHARPYHFVYLERLKSMIKTMSLFTSWNKKKGESQIKNVTLIL